VGYLHIENLYKNQEIMLFRRCYAMEKIHGTSAHIKWNNGEITFFSGGEKHSRFVELFDEEALKEQFAQLGLMEFTIFGEAYGGSQQGQSHRYGKELKFICFDVKIGDVWISVPQAESFCTNLGLEFVDYVEIPAEIEEMDAQRDRPSTQALRNGCGEHTREGVVLRPLLEVQKNNGSRIIVKHKGDEFKETATPRSMDPEKLKVLTEANAIADEWVTPMRLGHVLDKIDTPAMEKMREIIGAMMEDVQREAGDEIVWDQAVGKAVGKKTAQMVKAHFQNKLHGE